MKIKEIQNMTLRDLKKLSDADLRKAQNQLLKSRKTRMASFKKNKISSGVPKNIKNMKKASTRSSMISNINKMSNWMMRDTSTARGYKKAQKTKRKAIEEALNRKFKNEKEFDEFGRFMGAMQDRANGMWDVQSMSGADLFKEAKRLNLDPSQLVKNYDYWMDHLKDLEKIEKPVREGLNPSSYARSLKLPSISQYYKKLETNREKADRRRNRHKYDN